MATADILDQDEIDALLNGVDSGEVDTETDPYPTDGHAREYDLSSQDRIVRGRMPTLDMLNDRFARYLRISIFNMLRRTAEISVGEVKIIKFSEYIRGLFVPTNLNLIRVNPLRGTGLLVIDPKLLFIIVENFFGGDGRFYTKIEGREFTPTEMRVVHLLLNQVFQDLSEAWKPVMLLEFEYINSEVNPQFANIVSPTEVVVVTRFKIEMEGGGGELHITLPYSMLEPIRELLAAGIQSDRVESEERWTKTLQEDLKEVKVNMSCSLTEIELNLRELMSLGIGDIIPIDLPKTVVANVEGLPAYHCEFGSHEGHNALKIINRVQRVQHAESQLKSIAI
jgi:flagellar motor switch protein FliM